MSHFEVTVKSVDADVECAFVLPGLDASFWLGERPRHQLDLADHALQEEYVGGDQTARPLTRSGQERVQVDQWLRGLAPLHARTHR
jgi:hypothetical protein